MPKIDVRTEYDRLDHVIMGIGHGYHRSPDKVEIVNTTHQKTADTTGHPSERQLIAEFAAFRAAMEKHGVGVHEPELADDSVQDQTCPRDIGFVIGETLFKAGMRYASRLQEFDAVQSILSDFDGPLIDVPDGIVLEGGDVIVDGEFVFVGVGQRSDPEGAAFLAEALSETYRVIPVPTRALSEGEEVLHLDCAFNPLGLGHALIYPQGLRDIPAEMTERYDWIEVTRPEADALATNVFSIAPDLIIARDTPNCARVNAALREAGYRVEEVSFDGVPSTGGSFRCATMPLTRS